MASEPSYEDFVEWHVILPKPFLKRIPKEYFDPEEPGVLRILSDAEWRGIGITQSLGWEHYEVHADHVLIRDAVKTTEAHFRRVFSEPERRLRVPLLDAHSIHSLLRRSQSDEGRREGVLVRWRCMVQDTGFGCELFLATLKANGACVSGLYGAETMVDTAQDTLPEPENLTERTVVCAISPPGEMAWCEQLATGDSAQDTAGLALAMDKMDVGGTAEVQLCDRARIPVAEQPSITALVKCYDVDAAEGLRTTDMIDVVGLLDTS
ncbi:Cyclin-dependent kinases regulatory subunit (Cell division control protein cks1) [Malassezia vespertilionis]|uniref:Cyclin-dependent kinases regulatory subunit (Cell division control protein cks1) n=1 Tax=Malassezia vespertilionis TaxID=2020962 RepID=UPI0024B25C1B|nr:Cyclin-dependent kinases regulatory subunit (Cell division control protein cks1) [Malassezia vespertilionis]WFD05594.1 Cyclin-dependent kinases regulatory subunit (Cell division control protein cks1) [Malassezia vespertilionis]